MAIIALQNNPSGCYLWPKLRPKRERPRHNSGTNHEPLERRRRKPARWREPHGYARMHDSAGSMGLPDSGTLGQVEGLNHERSRRSLHDLRGQILERSFLATGGKTTGSIRGGG